MQPKLLGIFALTATLFFHTSTWAQNKLVRGKIQDENGSPLPKASIMVKGSTTGISSGDDGSFEINAPANATLVITGKVYHIEESTDLKTWSQVAFSITPAGTPSKIYRATAVDILPAYVATPAGTSRFYRLTVR